MKYKQSGAALFVALILLAILMVVGVTAVKNGTLQERMATNMHQANWAFNAATAGVNAFNNLANAGNSAADPSHILYRTRVSDSITFCIDENGQNADCGGVYLDGAAQKTEVTLVVSKQGCIPQLCRGTSLGTGTGKIQCQAFKATSLSDASGIVDGAEFWGFQYAATCD